jgi:ankyrin repeat protein
MNDKNYLLQIAISKQDRSLVVQAVNQGANISHTDFNGCNSAHLAAISGSIEISRFIYTVVGISIFTAKNNFSLTPFLLAAIYKHENLVTWFINELNYQISKEELDFLETKIVSCKLFSLINCLKLTKMLDQTLIEGHASTDAPHSKSRRVKI